MNEEIEKQEITELQPLEDGKPQRQISMQRQNSSWGRRTTLKGPVRALKLMILIVLLPTLFIAIPIYMRMHVYGGQFYPVGMTDMRLIDRKVSTTWCQSQLVKSNATFNAFLVSEKPKISDTLVPVSMTRELSLDDDMKEYWGFYLLEGTIVTVSTCVRWPGASLIMIRGHKHLQECAYIGDDSSEELEEILEAGNFGDINMLERLKKLLEDSPANQPETMRRHDSEILFHDPTHSEKDLVNRKNVNAELDKGDNDEELKEILEKLQAIKDSKKKKSRIPWMKPKNIIAVPQILNRHRETNIDVNEKQWFSFQELVKEQNKSRTLMDKILNKIRNHDFIGIFEDKSREKSNDELPDSAEKFQNINKLKTTTEANKLLDIDANQTSQGGRVDNSAADPNKAIDLDTKVLPVVEVSILAEEGIKNDTEDHLSDNKPYFQDLDEVYNEVYQKLTGLGDKGERVLNKLLSEIPKFRGNNTSANTSTTIKPEKSTDVDSEQKLKLLKDIILEVIVERENKRNDEAQKLQRLKRELYIKQAFEKDLNEDDEKGNAAIEEGFVPDGIADHHQILNETTIGDMSNSEFWSSFSSSEEALLECEGLILNLPLTPHIACKKESREDDLSRASLPNAVTYRVPTNGYYFFIFNSENEVQTNYIRVRFDLQKTIYDLTEKLMECKNSTGNCTMPLGFLSREKVVLEVPLRDNDSLWNEQFVVLSECEPRTSIYVLCAIAVPFLILLFGLQ